MAYKNKKKNKTHIQELKIDPKGWRKCFYDKKKARKQKQAAPLTIEEMEIMIANL